MRRRSWMVSRRSASVLPIPFEARVACEWLLAVITTAASVIIWKRLED